MNILIIEDDEILAKNIKKTFEKKIIVNKIRTIYSFKKFIEELNTIESFDIIIVDIILEYIEGKNWIDIIKIIRNKKLNIPIVIISWFSSIEWIKKAFDYWANDYLIKPFRLNELEVRIFKWFNIYLNSLNLTNQKNITYDQLIYKINENQFYYKNKKINLSKKSKYLLLIFISSPEKLIKEDFLINKLWCDRDVLKKRNLRICILRLKNILKKHWLEYLLKNIRGEWYIFKI